MHGRAVTLMALLACAACTSGPAHPAKEPRYDGHYEEDLGDVVYFMRFFPDGRAVLINGTKNVADTLPSFLRADAPGDPTMGWYNVPVRREGDSLFLTTRAEKGELDYRGAVVNDTTVRFERYSHINGNRAVKTYFFRPQR